MEISQSSRQGQSTALIKLENHSQKETEYGADVGQSQNRRGMSDCLSSDYNNSAAGSPTIKMKAILNKSPQPPAPSIKMKPKQVKALNIQKQGSSAREASKRSSQAPGSKVRSPRQQRTAENSNQVKKSARKAASNNNEAQGEAAAQNIKVEDRGLPTRDASEIASSARKLGAGQPVHDPKVIENLQHNRSKIKTSVGRKRLGTIQLEEQPAEDGKDSATPRKESPGYLSTPSRKKLGDGIETGSKNTLKRVTTLSND